jgi:hypothetical protein
LRFQDPQVFVGLDPLSAWVCLANDLSPTISIQRSLSNDPYFNDPASTILSVVAGAQDRFCEMQE